MSSDPVETSTPEAVSRAFYEAWKGERWERMVSCLQTSWARQRAAKLDQSEAEPLEARLERAGHEFDSPTWEEAYGGDLAEWLQQSFGRCKLVQFTVGKHEEFGPAIVDVPVEVGLKDRLGRAGYIEFATSVVCEDEDGAPSVEGVWGVNPISVLGHVMRAVNRG